MCQATFKLRRHRCRCGPRRYPKRSSAPPAPVPTSPSSIPPCSANTRRSAGRGRPNSRAGVLLHERDRGPPPCATPHSRGCHYRGHAYHPDKLNHCPATLTAQHTERVPMLRRMVFPFRIRHPVLHKQLAVHPGVRRARQHGGPVRSLRAAPRHERIL